MLSILGLLVLMVVVYAVGQNRDAIVKNHPNWPLPDLRVRSLGGDE